MIPFLDADEVQRRVTPRQAVAAIRAALADGLDPAHDPARTIVDVPAGQLLLMPSSTPAAAGVKIATVAPGNAALNMPRVQALYVVFDPVTLTPLALLDGATLTTLRTPAVSVAAVADALRPGLDVLIFGAGPQGQGHATTLQAMAGPLHRLRYVTRRGGGEDVLTLGTDEVAEAIASADVIVCATNAREPLFDSAGVKDTAVVIAVGAHEPTARELDAALFARAQVIVEDRATALREAGDVVIAIAERQLRPQALVALREVVTGEVPLASGRPIVFKSTGMAWEDLVVARAALA